MPDYKAGDVIVARGRRFLVKDHLKDAVTAYRLTQKGNLSSRAPRIVFIWHSEINITDDKAAARLAAKHGGEL